MREVSGVLATLCTLIWEMHSFVNTYQAGHIPGIYTLYYRLVFNNNFVQKQKNRRWVGFGPQAIVCQPLKSMVELQESNFFILSIFSNFVYNVYYLYNTKFLKY